MEPKRTPEKELRWGPFEIATWSKDVEYNGQKKTRRAVTLVRRISTPTSTKYQRIWLRAEEIPTVVSALSLTYKSLVLQPDAAAPLAKPSVVETSSAGAVG